MRTVAELKSAYGDFCKRYGQAAADNVVHSIAGTFNVADVPDEHRAKVINALYRVVMTPGSRKLAGIRKI